MNENTPLHPLEIELKKAMETIAALKAEGLDRDMALIELAAMLTGGV